jgi:hypothetical protein
MFVLIRDFRLLRLVKVSILVLRVVTSCGLADGHNSIKDGESMFLRNVGSTYEATR